MQFLKRLLGGLRSAVQALIRVVQRVVMACSLFLVYFLALGLTWALAWIFQRRLVRWASPGRDTYWEPATGYEADPAQALHQS